MYPKNPTLFKVSSYCHMRYHTTLSNFDELDVVFFEGDYDNDEKTQQ